MSTHKEKKNGRRDNSITILETRKQGARDLAAQRNLTVTREGLPTNWPSWIDYRKFQSIRSMYALGASNQIFHLHTHSNKSIIRLGQDKNSYFHHFYSIL